MKLAKQRPQGHPTVFTPQQNRSLRAALRELNRANKYDSQRELGRAIGVSQQVAGRLLADDGGFSYSTARNVVRLLGYEGVEDFFAKKGVTSSDPPHAKAG